MSNQDNNTRNQDDTTGSNKWKIGFVPFSSAVESSFWVRYCREKLDTIRLNEDPIPIIASYSTIITANKTNNTNTFAMDLPKLQIIESSLRIITHSSSSSNNNNDNNNPTITNSHHQQDSISVQQQQQQQQQQSLSPPRMNRTNVSGSLIGYNTIETFQKVDKNILLRDYYLPKFFQQHNTTANDLNRVLLITYPDLKNHTVIYWFGIPSFIPKIGSIYGIGQCQSLLKMQQNDNSSSSSYCWDTESYTTFINSYSNLCNNQQYNLPYFIYNTKSQSCYTLSINTYNTIVQEGSGVVSDDIIVVFVDPVGGDTLNDDTGYTSTVSQSSNPMIGWPLRNIVAYLSFHWNLGSQVVSFISYRTRRYLSTNIEHDDYSLQFKVLVPTKEDYGWTNKDSISDGTSTSTSTTTDGLNPLVGNNKYDNYKVVGWELNAKSKPGPRSVNLRPLLDTKHLAIQAADLNLKLMKWRMIPSLNIDKLQSCKVLLLGSGTLGCSVARTLLGWGIRTITFVDYGTVSYSNPVRQNLFTLDDCNANNGTGKQKAIAAADAVRTIAADVNSIGIHLSIPMPGHPSSSNNKDSVSSMHNIVDQLDALIQDADVIYLLTDTRESRWLPTVIAATYNKLLINAALGLDSWLVMRHGGGMVSTANELQQQLQQQQEEVQQPKLQRYGCYFCNDVVAPENSMKNRTIDQQCTVTRPGLAPIASSMAVELMVSLLHHPLYINAPAPTNRSNNTNFSPTTNDNDNNVSSDSTTSNALGIIPHQIRGSLVTYTMMIPTVPAFHCCTACSVPVIDSYRTNKYELIEKVCESINGSHYLEQLSGLTQFRNDATEQMNNFINDDDIDFGDDDNDDF